MTMMIRWGAAIVLGVFLIGMGVTKFTGAHIFQFIEAQAAANDLPLQGLFYPLLNHVTGLSEIVAGALVLLPATRFFGALVGAGVIGGAIAFHLSGIVGLPYLGISTPTGFAEGASAPWDLADFVPADPTGYSPALFIIALVMFGLALFNLYLARAKA